jgi:hypothetical protein
MITSMEFDAALQLITAYKLQLDKQGEGASLNKHPEIDLRQDLNDRVFRALQNYYELYYNINLEWVDLKRMDRDLLAAIDYDKMSVISGFGRSSLFNFKKLMVSYAVLDEMNYKVVK